MKTSNSNIAFFKNVPQPILLKDVDVMINHGGMNSITECILAEVPMLIYPGSRYLDQYGNSARVVYHGIGLRGKLKNEKTHLMISKMNLLLNESSFKENLKLIKSEIHHHKNYNNGLSLIQSQLPTI